MEMDRRQFVVFIFSVLYGPSLVSRMQESYKPENPPNKPQYPNLLACKYLSVLVSLPSMPT